MTRCAGCGEEFASSDIATVIDVDRLPVCFTRLEHVEAVRKSRAPRVIALVHEAQRAAFRARYGEPGKGGGG